jgi:hypothetical protein
MKTGHHCFAPNPSTVTGGTHQQKNLDTFAPTAEQI